ncbi:hypothetical protein IQ247_18240 [Plectonema cf. radiosum LEGE 06105]|uniref:DUF6816 domain-containing protein n=1 Tax=Plectonema cf. radiosum LEGE 06105 TaxID=945769 RepID=A0A8J7F9F1_9CYAN|nr:hypothetical protein [Plectonema radiosum]MBE9214584.1 hypothetical protein [Plectonema cf. radiosum LEGE 06105]
MKLIWTFCLILLLVFCTDNGNAKAGELNRRLKNFPQWEKLTLVKSAAGDLTYPEWMKGEWLVKSTMLDLVAPLAPDIVTPGFESNRQFLDRPVNFQVRFINPLVNQKAEKKKVIADRAYNSLNLAQAVLGDDVVKAVKLDPNSPNRQITFLRGERQLVSIVKNRATETTADGKFITTEVFQQLFKGGSRPYLNSVESTTSYKRLFTQSTSNPVIEADQVTAVYLSSQDPDYFKAANKPVALYRYRLEFFPITSKGNW